MALNVNMVNKKSDKTSLLALANVEALADGETSSCSVSTICYDTWQPNKQTGTISCTGKICSRTNTSVTCDGETTFC